MKDKGKETFLPGRKVAENLGLLRYVEIEPFDEVGTTLGGHYSKGFVRYDLDCLKELKNELRSNPNCAYKIAYNEAIIEGFAPKYVPVLAKKITGGFLYNDKLAQEVLSSRLLNLWGQSTVYNFIISEEDELLGSVDFISPGQEFITCDDFGFCGMQTISGIRAQRIHLRRFFKNELDRTDEDVDNDIENILGDFLLAKVVRKHLLCDPDIKRIENLGVLIDGNQKKVSLAPHYDLEYSYAANTPSEDMYYQITMYSKWVPAFKEKFERLVGFLEKSLEVDESTGETQIERVVNDSNFDFHLEEKVKNLSLLRAKETVEFAKEKGFYNEEKGM